MNESFTSLSFEEKSRPNSQYSRKSMPDSYVIKELDISSEPFYFESDALALRNNPDYSCVLKTLVLLETQRVQACSDIEALIDMKQEALNNPGEFLRNFNQNVPQPQKIYIIPDFDLDKYYECVDISDYEAIKCQNTHRVHSLRQSVKLIQQLETFKTPGECESICTVKISAKSKVNDKQNNKDVNNYNKSWTVAEQRQLEELLLEFPPEDNEAQRFRKIANKLGRLYCGLICEKLEGT